MPIKLDGMSEVTKNMEALKRALDSAAAGLFFDPQKPEEVERSSPARQRDAYGVADLIFSLGPGEDHGT